MASIHQTPSLEVSSSAANTRKITPPTPSTSRFSLPFTFKSQFNALVVGGRPLLGGFNHSSVPRAVATPNSVLSEQAFEGLSLHQEDDDVYDSEGEVESGFESESTHDDELDLSKLGLPQRLVDSLLKRGITHLFPIQVNFLLFYCVLDDGFFFICNFAMLNSYVVYNIYVGYGIVLFITTRVLGLRASL